MTTRSFARTAAWVVIGAAACALAGLASRAHAARACDEGDLGCAIFSGAHPVNAHLRDDTYALPPSTTRCVNCHAQNAPGGQFAPPLTAATLLDIKSRRGGPPLPYDPGSFCRAVREGIDPANVLLRKAMPQFQISARECVALWTYLTKR